MAVVLPNAVLEVRIAVDLGMDEQQFADPMMTVSSEERAVVVVTSEQATVVQSRVHFLYELKCKKLLALGIST